MEMIDKQEAIDVILGQPPELHYPSWYAEQIRALPPAQPEIIHCKDCKHYQRLSESCRSLRLKTGGERYCADAERKVTE